jgi:hypothetical protein
MKTRIVYVKKIPQGFIGMNAAAAREHHIPYHHPKNVIEIKKGLSKRVRKHTEIHERVELYQMKNNHERYRTAHKQALEVEATIKKFPKRHVKEVLNSLGVRKK